MRFLESVINYSDYGARRVDRNNLRADLALSGFQNNCNNKQNLLDFTSIAALATNVIDSPRKQSGYAAAKVEESKRSSYANHMILS
mmetsp:Transcript_20593/g.24967  ORF Transcript_20593/g.24967 Transcript_20593/m.24967 type:complete len:86 (+) Transcript_20593:1057-1314(+)